MLKDKTLTYISLFSSAGVGCYGFKKAGFQCIATNELIQRRLEVQRFNKKCKYDTGYICDDITLDSTKDKIFAEIDRWKKLGNDRVDVLIATPPCQGMSVANHKKTSDEIKRNSLVVESIQIISKINPRFFIFENVAAFVKTGCTAPDGTIKAIGEVIDEELSGKYAITSRILNFKNYGSNSSRTRTVVIGVSKEFEDYIAPIELYPEYTQEKTLKEVIGNLPKLSWGEICSTDFYHAFRTYDTYMRPWIHDLKEGEGAFDNADPMKRPHKVVDGNIIPNKQKNGDKYTRQCWDKVAPCIHTRNDQLASQNTVHPVEDRVFSIRELMMLMTIPDDFMWVENDVATLNGLTDKEKRIVLKKEEIKIRQSIGEAVPTTIFFQIAKNISAFMSQTHLNSTKITQVIKENDLSGIDNLGEFVKKNSNELGLATLSRIAELANTERENNAAYYTNKGILNEIYRELPDIGKDEIWILEPSVGVGNFLPFLFKKYEYVKRVNIDVIDIDADNLEILKLILDKITIPNNVRINYICDDFLLHEIDRKYDIVIGNPPFSKLNQSEAKKYLKDNVNKNTTNTFEFFLEKAVRIADEVVLITPKAVLNTPEFSETREWLNGYRVRCIQDFGEYGFKGVLVETICLHVSSSEKPNITKVISLPQKISIEQKQKYITDKKYPYWIIYRNDDFDRIASKLDFDVFTVFRDRQITNSVARLTIPDTEYIRVIKSRNISNDGTEIIDIPDYDAYVELSKAKTLTAYKYVNDNTVFLTPNMTYHPRVMRNINDVIVNGSVAVLIPKTDISVTDEQLLYFSTDEYRFFYKIARNYQTRSLNVDATSVFFYGLLKETEGK